MNAPYAASVRDLRPGAEPALTPRLLARYADRIERHVRAVLGSNDRDREDLVQDVLVTVLTNVDSLRNPACLDRWVHQVTVNSLRAALRKRRLRRHGSLDSLPEELLPSSQEDLEARELAARAMEVMDRLPPKDRQLLISHWLSPGTVAGIATDARCSPVTVRRRLFKAKSRFERLARKDPALAARFLGAGSGPRRWRYLDPGDTRQVRAE